MKVLRDHLGSSFVVHVLSDGLELAVGLRIICEDVEVVDVVDINGDNKTFFMLHGQRTDLARQNWQESSGPLLQPASHRLK